MQYIRRTVTKIKNFFKLFQHQDPFDEIKNKIDIIDLTSHEFEEINLRLNQLSLDEPQSENQNIIEIQQTTNEIEYKKTVEKVCSIMTKKQKEFYIKITEEEFTKIKRALKNPKYERLNYGKWLNDEIINDYLKQLPLDSDIVILNSFQLELLNKSDNTKFNRMIQRAKINQNVKHILAPYNYNNTHWFAFHIDFERNLITIYDSLQKQKYPSVFQQILAFAVRIKNTEYQLKIGSCPQQTNYYDCGVFTIKNIQILSKYPQAILINYYDQSIIFYDRLLICLKLLN